MDSMVLLHDPLAITICFGEFFLWPYSMLFRRELHKNGVKIVATELYSTLSNEKTFEWPHILCLWSLRQKVLPELRDQFGEPFVAIFCTLVLKMVLLNRWKTFILVARKFNGKKLCKKSQEIFPYEWLANNLAKIAKWIVVINQIKEATLGEPTKSLIPYIKFKKLLQKKQQNDKR